MTRIFRTAVLAAAFSAIASLSMAAPASKSSPAAAAKLEYLSVIDTKAVSLLECADIIGIAHQVGGTVGDDKLAGVYLKAGLASVVKSALLAVDNGTPPKVSHARFDDPAIVQKITDDHRLHAKIAEAGLLASPLSYGLDILGKCSDAASVKEASDLGDWLDKDVGILKDVK